MGERLLRSSVRFVFLHPGQCPCLACSIFGERQPEKSAAFAGKSIPGLMARPARVPCYQARQPGAPSGRPLQLLTDPELEVVERVLVDLLDTLRQGEREVGQGAQVSPFVLTLLGRERHSFQQA